MTDGLAAVVLAAGAGTRLRPLTLVRPKALCPVDNVPLVDIALGQVASVTRSVAVNVHHGRALLESYLSDRDVHVSVEEPDALGTAGALGQLREWIDGRDVLLANADAWRANGLGALTDDWDGDRTRLLVTDDPARGDFGRWRYAGAALIPWAEVRELSPEPAGLYEVSWARLEKEGALDLVPLEGRFIDCGTPADYLAANLAASGGESVIGEGAVVAGRLERSVVWPGGVVGRDEHLVDAIRVWDWMTVPG
jgi:N-acetyl-alpha-D-muramate 1-phosphate uridylyltransferase